MKKISKKTVLPQQARSMESRNKILEAAETVFSEKGLHGARIDSIAQQAGINKQRIYAYFGSKKELYREVLLKVYGQAAKSEELISLTENELNDMTGRILRSFFDFHQNNPKFWRLLSWENLNGGKSLSQSDWAQIRNSYISHIDKLYRLGQSRGYFSKQINFDTYILTIFSTTYFYFSNQITISHLLDKKLSNISIRNVFEEQVKALIQKGASQDQ